MAMRIECGYIVSCANTAMIGGVTPEKCLLIFVLLWKNANMGISGLLSRPFSFDRHVGMINLMLVLRTPEGRCYGNQLILGPFCKHRNWSPLVFALEFRNGMQYRHQHQDINTSGDAATSCKNLVNFGAVTPEITYFICLPLWLLDENRQTISTRYAGISKRVGRLNFRWAHLKQRRYIPLYLV